MSQNYTYTAQSVETGYYIISTKDDKPDQDVVTADGNGGIPDGATLTFDKALGSITEVTIKGINGIISNLGYEQNATSGSNLIWSKDAASWQVDMTSPDVYEIVPKGQDLYWVTNQTIDPNVEVKDGKDIMDNENKWTLKKGKKSGPMYNFNGCCFRVYQVFPGLQ
ncbi:hypothetical protein EDD18DRAFT_1105529 [Armillaria luteobubalina]|uniref:Uncharacterized protein n=1 Tax=Armillaria luteobubalina TaxID=153913 RepID=A0AA39UWZ1_9AGAR|nr:hypothetical protein EDD18DRAFT_1105529 [Armillaria luteobubalina]